MTAELSPNGLIRAGCYCRISSDPKDKRAGVDRQREDTTVLCEAKGWTPAGFYVDNDKSASSGKQRPEWDRLLADIEANKIDAIAVWNQDRGWRQMSELEELRKFFRKQTRKILLSATVLGDIDLYDPYSVYAAQQRTANSELETAVMKIRMRREHRQRADRGEPEWRRAFGYLSDGSREPDPVTAPLVREAYAAVVAGASLGDICRMWNDAGALTQQWVRPKDDDGKPIKGSEPRLVQHRWTQPQVSNFLRKARNAGLRSYGGNHDQLVKATWPALVDEATWRAAQDVLNQPKRRPGKKTVQRHLLTGVLQCGKPGCGHYLSGQHTPKDRHGNHAIVYACKGCRGVSVRADFAVPYVYSLVIERLSREDAKDLLKAEIHDAAEAEAIRNELNTLYTELENIGIERGQLLLTGQQAKTATDIIMAKIAVLERKQNSAERLRVFDGLELGTPEVEVGIRALTPDRFRAVVDVLMTVTVMPVGKGHRVNGDRFDPDRIIATPKQ